MLGPGAEFDAIRSLVAGWGHRAAGIGDDAAVIDVPRGEYLVVSVDASVENIHFRRHWLMPYEIGWRSTMAAFSDLAAMGARPVALLSAIALPDDWRPELDAIGTGIGDAAAEARAPIVGGNMTRARDLSLTTTVVGVSRRPLTRAGARPGDGVYVTGCLGGALLALRALERGAAPPGDARVRFVRPVARLRAGAWLASHGASAGIDVSDGLAADAGHLAAAASVTVRLDLDAVPVFAGATPLDAVASGEEYELLVTLPGAAADETAEMFRRALDMPLTRIGAIVAGRAEVALYSGKRRVALPGGHDHLSP